MGHRWIIVLSLKPVNLSPEETQAKFCSYLEIPKPPGGSNCLGLLLNACRFGKPGVLSGVLGTAPRDQVKQKLLGHEIDWKKRSGPVRQILGGKHLLHRAEDLSSIPTAHIKVEGEHCPPSSIHTQCSKHTPQTTNT